MFSNYKYKYFYGISIQFYEHKWLMIVKKTKRFYLYLINKYNVFYK